MPPVDNLCRALVAPDVIELRAADNGGDMMHGHFAVFGEFTEINSYFEGRFLERIAPGAFTQTFAERGDKVKVLYDHGADPMIGNKPLGKITNLAEDKRGARYEVELFDASYVRELVPALRAGALGASFRFSIAEGGEVWEQPTRATRSNPDKLRERTITAVNLFEFGPVTFPAYDSATAGMRSTTDQFFDRLTNDPRFLARMTERLGSRVVEQMLSDAADGPQREGDSGDAAPATCRDSRLLAMRAQLVRLR